MRSFLWSEVDFPSAPDVARDMGKTDYDYTGSDLKRAHREWGSKQHPTYKGFLRWLADSESSLRFAARRVLGTLTADDEEKERLFRLYQKS